MLHKLCSTCREVKPFDCFHKQKGRRFDLRSQCKICHNVKSRACEKTERGKEVTQRKYLKKIKTEKFKKWNLERSLRIYWSDPDYYKLKESARRAGTTVGVLNLITEKDKVCKLCGSNKELQFDHIHPRSKGGKGTLENLQLLCQSCNLFKSNRLFLPGGGMIIFNGNI